ncbi:hypothetical protein BOX15_Mlig030552g1, partial [Macrostomum lignano]
ALAMSEIKKQPIESPLTAPDEYDYDSSDDEDIRNTVGNVPMHWYTKYPHIGYDTEGKKLMKPDTGDQLDDFMAKMDDPEYWRTVIDPKTGQRIVLCDEDVQLVKNIVRGRVPDPNVDPYEDHTDWFTSDTMATPVTAHPPSKSSFVPSKWERLRVGRMVHAIKMGWMLTGEQRAEARRQREAAARGDNANRFYDIWDRQAGDEDEAIRRKLPYIRPPKKAPPTHYESYNPPEEYLFDDEELEKWRNQEDYERRVDFVPTKYAALRRVPAYPGYTSELYERCQDLHLAARVVRHRVSMDPEDLLPKLPAPRDLRPFPHLRVLQYLAWPEEAQDSQQPLPITACSVDPSGQWFAASGAGGRLAVFELTTGYRAWSAQLESASEGGLVSAAWNPCADRPCIAAGGAGSGRVYLVATDRCDRLLASRFAEAWAATSREQQQQQQSAATWTIVSTEASANGAATTKSRTLATVQLPTAQGGVTQLAWHRQGDYFLTVSDSGSLLVHRLTTRSSQSPLGGAGKKAATAAVCCAQFDPVKPVLYVAEKARIQVYDLAKLTKLKTLKPNARALSCLSVHPTGCHLLAGSLDSRLAWFDLDLACTPYKQLRIHSDGVRQCVVHPSLPLSASVSDDGSCLVLHSRVYADLLENPLLVPVKRLRGHQVGSVGGSGIVRVTACDFHPRLPWLVTGGSDGRIVFYSS